MQGHTGWRSEEICDVLVGLGCGLRPPLHRPSRPESLNATVRFRPITALAAPALRGDVPYDDVVTNLHPPSAAVKAPRVSRIVSKIGLNVRARPSAQRGV